MSSNRIHSYLQSPRRPHPRRSIPDHPCRPRHKITAYFPKQHESPYHTGPVRALSMRRRRLLSSCNTIYSSDLAPVMRARNLETVLPVFEKKRSEVTLVAGIASKYLAPNATRGRCFLLSRHQRSTVQSDSRSTTRPRYALHSASKRNDCREPAPTFVSPLPAAPPAGTVDSHKHSSNVLRRLAGGLPSPLVSPCGASNGEVGARETIHWIIASAVARAVLAVDTSSPNVGDL